MSALLPIGGGDYPGDITDDVLRLVTVPGTPVLVMGVPNRERHDVAGRARAAGADVTRRFDPGDVQLDFDQTPESQAAVWYGWILGGLTPDQFKAIYHRALGPNECIKTGDETHWPWLVAFEIALCHLLHQAEIAYAWGSIAVGNVDPLPFATLFQSILALADATCYHIYAAPGRWTLEDEPNRDYARRPLAWWQACQAKGTRFPPLFAGEIGPFYPWTEQGMSPAAHVALLQQIAAMLASWRALGMPIVGGGGCLFGVGVEGKMGDQWNVSRATLDAIGTINREVIVPTVGEGYQKFIGAPCNLGQPLENEFWHMKGTPRESSLAVFENGKATWSLDTNETIAIKTDGTIWRDGGNDVANAGAVHQAAGPFR